MTTNLIEPGLEMDLLVGAYVMGAKWIYEDDEQPDAVPYLEHEDWVHYPKTSKHSHNGVYSGGMPSYSTSIAHAWEVVEKLSDEFKPYDSGIIKEYSCTTHEPFYRASFGRHQKYQEISNESAPHAICLAALKAKGVINV